MLTGNDMKKQMSYHGIKDDTIHPQFEVLLYVKDIEDNFYNLKG